ncbi:MAG: serine/threonine-protein kinase [Polyangiales bacterium]
MIGGRYAVEGTLGAGGMAVVYRVKHLLTGQHGALKVLRVSALATDTLREKFVQEARIGGRIQSDHVVEVTDAGLEPDGTPWFVMELLHGETLGDRVARAGPMPPAEFAAVLRQICHGLSAAHRAGVVHRDLKPANVFLARSRHADVALTVKILDFGIARLLQDARGAGTNSLLAGTPGWMAPEQAISGMMVSPRADVWALGLVAFELLVGASYFPPDQGIGFDALPSASTRAARLGRGSLVPPWFDGWFGRCVAMDPSARFSDVDAAYSDLALHLGSALASTPPSIPSRPHPTPRPATTRLELARTAVAREVARLGWPKVVALGAGLIVGTVGAIAWIALRTEAPSAHALPRDVDDARPPPPTQPPPPTTVLRRADVQWTPVRPTASSPSPLQENPVLSGWVARWAARMNQAGTLTEADWPTYYTDPVNHGGQMPRSRVAYHWTRRAAQGVFRYDPAASTWFVSTLADSQATCRVDADSDDVIVVRLAATDTGFEDAVALSCVPMFGTYSLRLRIVSGAPVVCAEAWYDCTRYCQGCSSPRIRGWGCCRH